MMKPRERYVGSPVSIGKYAICATIKDHDIQMYQLGEMSVDEQENAGCGTHVVAAAVVGGVAFGMMIVLMVVGTVVLAAIAA